MRPLGIWLTVLAAGCNREPMVDAPDGSTCQPAPMRIAASDEVDVLFVIDNGFSGGYLEPALSQSFHLLPEAAAALAATGGSIDLHVGVITTDYGAGATGAPGCQPAPGGQRGLLQAVGVNSPNTCKPPVGGSFLAFSYAANGTTTSNASQGLNVEQTFTCMAAVGSSGCGFSAPLEASYAAVQHSVPENAGFLRDEAQLTVVFVTDKDDCSMAPTATLSDKNQTPEYGYEDHFRCFRFGVECGQPPSLPGYAASNGPLLDCVPAPNPGDADPGRLTDVQRYRDFFTRPNGVKRDPGDVALFAFAGPASPPEVILTNPGTAGGTPYSSCGALSEYANPPCVPVVQHACQNENEPIFFADPTIRLKALLDGAATHQLFSLCDATLDPTMQAIADHATTSVASAPHCLPDALPDPDHPDCVVEDLTVDANKVTTAVILPQCDGHTMPCWSIDKKTPCNGVSPDGVGVTLHRDGPLAIGQSTQVTCAKTCP